MSTAFSRFGLEGQVAFVTGASSGLGTHFARTLHAAGASVILAARRVDRLVAITDELGSRALAVHCDVADERQIINALSQSEATFGPIDIVVNNAGVSFPQATEEMSATTFRRVVDVNLAGSFTVAAQVSSSMLERGQGAIVNVASIFGLVANSPINDAAYAASKAGLINLTRQLAVEWAQRGVRVNALAPGWFPTEMNEDLWSDERSSRWVERNTPLGRAGRLDELDGPLLLLASQASSFITGHTLVVDGGWTAR